MEKYYKPLADVNEFETVDVISTSTVEEESTTQYHIPDTEF